MGWVRASRDQGNYLKNGRREESKKDFKKSRKQANMPGHMGARSHAVWKRLGTKKRNEVLANDDAM